tara:strand:- start:238 stop:999 length:762 start_codon:yes stop_codon:yes gene_type:complete
MIDSHCHLDHEPLFSNLDIIINRSKAVGIKKILTICTTIDSFLKIKEIVKKDEIIFGTYGIHPHEAKSNKVTCDLIIDEIRKNEKIIGVGETGLDFYYNYSDRNDQISSFCQHIEASINLNIPLIVHSRNSEKEILEIFNEYKKENLKILMHCFTGSKDFAKKLLDFDAFFSASGIITFKNSAELKDTFKFLPIEKLLIETDSPFLAPEPNRGKKNEPSFVKFTALKLAEIKGLDETTIVNHTDKNFTNLFFK